MANIQWIAAPAPTVHGEIWEWPMAVYCGPGKKPAAYVLCREACSERGLNNGPINHPLQVVILKYNIHNIAGWDPSKGRRMLDKANHFTRLEMLIAYTQTFLERNGSWQPLLV